tara:strand:+ start:578 stop:721 length:144 start_codon:yes stop_codon:yes gene_type:complete
MGNFFCKLKFCNEDEDINEVKIYKKKKKIKLNNLYKTSPGPPIFNLL